RSWEISSGSWSTSSPAATPPPTATRWGEPLAQQIPTQYRWAPVSLDVADYQLGALFVRDIGLHARVVHGVCEVADEDAVDAPAGHLADGERAAQDAHVRVDAHHQQRVDAARLD